MAMVHCAANSMTRDVPNGCALMYYKMWFDRAYRAGDNLNLNRAGLVAGRRIFTSDGSNLRGACAVLEERDLLTSTSQRDGHCIARG